MRLFSIAIALIFVLFAAVQWNDPDPWHWMLIYAYVAALWAWSAWRKPDRGLVGVGLGMTLLQLLDLIPGLIDWVARGMPSIVGSMEASSPHIELMREFLGSLLCSLALIALWRWHSRR